MPTLTPCLFYDGAAIEAVEFYASVFPDTRIGQVTHTEADTPFMRKGDVLSVEFTLLGQPFVAINGNNAFSFTEAVSFQVHCESQAEVDRYWDALLAGGGTEVQCGWLKDRFGLSWQVIPTEMGKYLGGDDPAGCARAMEAMLQMTKLDLDALRRAYEGAA